MAGLDIHVFNKFMIRCLALGYIVYEMHLKLLIVREKAVVRTTETC